MKLSLIVEDDMFEVIRRIAYQQKIKPSEVVRAILADNPIMRETANAMNLDIDKDIKKPIGGDYRKRAVGLAEAVAEAQPTSQDKPQTPATAQVSKPGGTKWATPKGSTDYVPVVRKPPLRVPGTRVPTNGSEDEEE